MVDLVGSWFGLVIGQVYDETMMRRGKPFFLGIIGLGGKGRIDGACG